jgi:hypothetical protein
MYMAGNLIVCKAAVSLSTFTNLHSQSDPEQSKPKCIVGQWAVFSNWDSWGRSVRFTKLVIWQQCVNQPRSAVLLSLMIFGAKFATANFLRHTLPLWILCGITDWSHCCLRSFASQVARAVESQIGHVSILNFGCLVGLALWICHIAGKCFALLYISDGTDADWVERAPCH